MNVKSFLLKFYYLNDRDVYLCYFFVMFKLILQKKSSVLFREDSMIRMTF